MAQLTCFEIKRLCNDKRYSDELCNGGKDGHPKLVLMTQCCAKYKRLLAKIYIKFRNFFWVNGLCAD